MKRSKGKRVYGIAAMIVAVTILIVGISGYQIAKEIGLIGRNEPGVEEPGEEPGVSPDQPDYLFKDNKLTLLVLGVDYRAAAPGSRSDTMMLAFLDMNEPSVKLLSIPRDTRVNIPGYGYEKFTHSHAYGGADLVMETINGFLGTDVEYYVEVDFEGFKDVVDALGGIELEVPSRMYYPGEGIDLYPGVQTLDGDKALQFVRYRSDGGDLVRIARQQQFLKELAKKALNTKNLWTATKLVGAANDMTVTDLSATQLLYIATSMMDLDVDSIEVATIPGESKKIDGLWYIIADEEKALDLVENFQGTDVQDEDPEEVDETIAE
ncbi:LCP family protein [Clostridia bacterium]|nr:LCP family protein [Clostridia bacterium]